MVLSEVVKQICIIFQNLNDVVRRTLRNTFRDSVLKKKKKKLSSPFQQVYTFFEQVLSTEMWYEHADYCDVVYPFC